MEYQRNFTYILSVSTQLYLGYFGILWQQSFTYFLGIGWSLHKSSGYPWAQREPRWCLPRSWLELVRTGYGPSQEWSGHLWVIFFSNYWIIQWKTADYSVDDCLPIVVSDLWNLSRPNGTKPQTGMMDVSKKRAFRLRFEGWTQKR